MNLKKVSSETSGTNLESPKDLKFPQLLKKEAAYTTIA